MPAAQVVHRGVETPVGNADAIDDGAGLSAGGKTRGRGLPSWGAALRCRSPRIRNPGLPNSRTASPLRSNPAASSYGVGKAIPKISLSSTARHAITAAAASGLPGINGPMTRNSSSRTIRWACSMVSEKSRGSMSFRYMASDTSDKSTEKSLRICPKNIPSDRHNGRAALETLGPGLKGGFRLRCHRLRRSGAELTSRYGTWRAGATCGRCHPRAAGQKRRLSVATVMAPWR